MADVDVNETIATFEGVDTVEDPVSAVLPDETMQAEISDFLRTEIDQVQSDRESVEDDWATWRRQRLSRPEQKTKNYPWPNASNVTVPLSEMVTNALFATTKHKFSQRVPLLMADASDSIYKAHAEALTNLISQMMESKHHVNIRKKNQTMFYDLVSMGTQFAKVPWDIRKWMFKRDGQQIEKVVMDSPNVIPIQLEDFFCKLHIDNLQEAPWIAVRSRMQEYELRQKQANGIFVNVEQILGSEESEVLDARAEEMDDMNLSSTMTEDVSEYDIYECHVFWDVDGDGVPEDVKLWFHKDDGVILRAEFNELGVRDVVRMVYRAVPYQLYGIGVGHMVQYLQHEADSTHNIRINSMHLSSLQGFVTKTGSRHLDNFQFKPLFNLRADNPDTDVKAFGFPDVSGSTFQAEAVTMNLAQQVTGASDALMGQPDSVAKSRTTTSGYLMQQQQGYKLYEAISKNIEEAYAEIGLMMVYQMVSYPDRSAILAESLVSPEDAALLQEIFAMNVEDIPTRFRFKVQVTEIDKTEEAQLQKDMTLMQLHSMYTDRTIQLAMQIMQVQQMAPQMAEPIMKLYVAQTKIMQDIIERMTKKNPEEFTVYVKDLDMMLQQQEMMKDQQVLQMKGAMSGSNGAMGPVGPAAGPAGGNSVPAGVQGGGEVSGGAPGAGAPEASQF